MRARHLKEILRDLRTTDRLIEHWQMTELEGSMPSIRCQRSLQRVRGRYLAEIKQRREDESCLRTS